MAQNKLRRSSRIWATTKITSTEKLVLLALNYLADENGECSPSSAEIANICHLTRSTVSRTLSKLAKKGCITKTPQYTDAGQKNNFYKISDDFWPLALSAHKEG